MFGATRRIGATEEFASADERIAVQTVEPTAEAMDVDNMSEIVLSTGPEGNKESFQTPVWAIELYTKLQEYVTRVENVSRHAETSEEQHLDNQQSFAEWQQKLENYRNKLEGHIQGQDTLVRGNYSDLTNDLNTFAQILDRNASHVQQQVDDLAAAVQTTTEDHSTKLNIVDKFLVEFTQEFEANKSRTVTDMESALKRIQTGVYDAINKKKPVPTQWRG